jgi:hypothetical protein
MFSFTPRFPSRFAGFAALGIALAACDSSPVAPTEVMPAGELAFAKGGGGAGGPTDITTCGTTISAPGKYTVRANLSGCANGIKITSNDVTLHLGGYTISGNGSGAGINLVGANNVSIHGPGTVRQFLYGLYLEGATTSRFSSILATGNAVGMILNADFSQVAPPPSSANEFYDSQFNGNGNGIVANGGVNNKFRGISVSNNTNFGFYLYWADNNDVKSSTFNANGFSGIYLVHWVEHPPMGNLFQDNEARGNGWCDVLSESPTPTNTFKSNRFGCGGSPWIQ